MDNRLYYWNSTYYKNCNTNYIGLKQIRPYGHEVGYDFYCLGSDGKIISFICWEYYEL